MPHSFIQQLEKHYKVYLKNRVIGKTFEPIVLRGGKQKPETSIQLHEQVAVFQQNEKKDGKPGWTISWEDWASKKLGNQKWPAAVSVNTIEDLLYLTSNNKHYEDFQQLLNELLQWNSQVRDILHQQPELILAHQADWKTIQAVVDFLLANDTTNQYVRSIPVPAHTKFIQLKKSLILALLKTLDPNKYPQSLSDLESALGLRRKPFLFAMRWLDTSLADQYMSGVDQFAISAEALKKASWKIKNIILVENETNLYMLPQKPATLAIFSSGKALHLLKEIDLFHNAQSYYWGDLDEEGFKMLNDIRQYYPTIKSLFMDEQTVSLHLPELHLQPYPYKIKNLALLTESEMAAYQLMFLRNARIEQERLLQDHLFKHLNMIV